MGDNKEKIKEMIEKINREIEALRNDFSDLVKMVLEKEKPEITIENLPESIRGLVTLQYQADKIIIKPHKYLGKDKFNELSKFVKDYGGEYVSDGKNSRFEIKR